jgi:hypothetical protein
MKVNGSKVWWVWRMWKTLKGQILDCCNSWTGSMGPSIVMLENTCTQTPSSFDRLDFNADAGDSLGDLHMSYWSQASSWACTASKLLLVHPKRESG